MKKIGFFIVLNIFLISSLSAQNNAYSYGRAYGNDYKKILLMPNSSYEKENIKNKRPIPYAPLREADVAWTKIVWRIIDVREKMNQLLYYPTTPQDDRMKLIDLLLYGIENEGLTAYDPTDDEFTEPISLSSIYEKFDGGADTIPVRNRLTGELESTVVGGDFSSSEVLQYMLKEQWLFDKNASILKVRVIGICPIRVYYKEDYNDYNEYDDISVEDEFVDESSTLTYTDDRGAPSRMKLFWVYFPEARPLLARYEVFNPSNDVARISYDNLFMKRRFNSYISQISNVHDNRSVGEYNTGIETILESERIKKVILDFENDLWEY